MAAQRLCKCVCALQQTHLRCVLVCVADESLDKAVGEGGVRVGGGGGRGAQLHQAVALICKFSQMTHKLRAVTAPSCILLVPERRTAATRSR